MVQEGNTAEEHSKAKPVRTVKQLLVRYGKMGVLGWFEHNENSIPKTKKHVIIKTERGLELGDLIGPYSYRSGNFRLNPEQVDQYFKQADQTFEITGGGRFVRFATPEDLCEQEHLEKSAIEESKCCQRYARELGLDMKIIEAEHLFGGERIIFYFLSDGRVDFRELVKRLAREYQTRIELRQIGSRDEARLISDYESCGMECCCKRFLKILEPVNMRMAKLQKATLDPSKISGHCGRLKCCLRYEDETYRDLKKNLPAKNTPVQTPKGTGRVLDVQILTQLVVVQMDSGDRQAWRLDEIDLLDANGVPIPRPDRPAKSNPETGAAGGEIDFPHPNFGSDRFDEMAAERTDIQIDVETPRSDRPAQTGAGGPDCPRQDRPDNRPKRKKNRRRNSNRGDGGGQNPNTGAQSHPNPDNSGHSGDRNNQSNRRRGGRNRNRRNRSGRPDSNAQNGNPSQSSGEQS